MSYAHRVPLLLLSIHPLIFKISIVAKNDLGLTFFVLLALLSWAEWLREPGDEAKEARIRRRTKTVRPCAGENFLNHLEECLGRVLRPQKASRKRKTAIPEATQHDMVEEERV